VEIHGLDYRRLKLFMLSLLWRFTVTTLRQFRGVNLGSDSERLRQMLIAENPGHPLDYPCLITAVVSEGEHFDDAIVRPSLARIGTHNVWRIVVPGFIFKFFVSPRPAVEVPSRLFLQNNGSLTIMIREITTIEFLCQDIREIVEAQP
jgi:hypothetical protein